MKVLLLVSLVTFVYFIDAAVQNQWIYAFFAFLAAVLATRRAYPELPPPREEGEPSERFRWLLLLLGIVSGWYGARFWSTHDPRWLMGAPFQAIALYALIHAFPRRAPRIVPGEGGGPTGSAGAQPAPTAPATPSSVVPLLPLLILAAVAGFSIYDFAANRFVPGLIYLSIAFLGAWILGLKYNESGDVKTRTWEKRWFLAILMLAVLMRFPFVHQHLTGLQIDEANHLIDGEGVLHGRLRSAFVTGWWGNPSFVYYGYALFFKLFGVNIMAARIMATCLSIGALIYFYRLARFYVAPAAALLATLMFTYGWYHLFYSLSPFTNIYTVFFELATFYHLEKALRLGGRSDYAWSGLWAAASVMSYISGRLVVGMVIFSLLYRLLLGGRRFLKIHGMHLGLMLLSFLWLIGPFLYYLHQSLFEFIGRAQELSILNEVKRTGHWWFPAQTYGYTILSFFYNMGADPRFGLYRVPTVDAVAAVLLCFGLALSIARLRSDFSGMVLPGFCVALMANAFAIQGENAGANYLNMQRLYLVLPFAFLLVSRSLQWLSAGWKGRASGVRWLFGILLGTGILAAAAWNAKVYYHDIHLSGSSWDSLGFNHLQMAEVYESMGSSCHIFTYNENFSSVPQFVLQGKIKCVEFPADFGIPPRYRAEKDVLFVFAPWKAKELQEKVRQTYPGAVWKDYPNYQGNVSTRSAFITRPEYEMAQKKAGVVPDVNFP